MRRLCYLIGAATISLSACQHISPAPKSDDAVKVTATVTVSKDAAGYAFAYKALFADEDGNFDFTQKGAIYRPIAITFTIAEGSPSGLKFTADSSGAVWIADKREIDNETGSPEGPYRGQQFKIGQVSADGQSFVVENQNNDGLTYRYALRFDLNGETIVHDPDVNNGPPL